jgi:rhodanese-related sulfurtransferase
MDPVAMMRAAALAVPLFFLLASCSSRSGPELSAPDALYQAEAGKLTLIDIRTPQEWHQTGVARGAQRLDMRHPGGPEGFVTGVLDRVGGDRATPIGLICRTGNRSGHVQRLLLDNGFTQVFNIREGMVGSSAGPGWIRRGLPVEPCVDC